MFQGNHFEHGNRWTNEKKTITCLKMTDVKRFDTNFGAITIMLANHNGIDEHPQNDSIEFLKTILINIDLSI